METVSDFLNYQRQILPLKLHSEDCRGRTFIVTGSNTGLGYECTKHLVELEAARVILAVRNVQSGESAKTAIEETSKRYNIMQVWQLDLASYDSVRKFVEKADAELDRIDSLVCNAAMANLSWEVVEGMESNLTVNLLSNLLLTTLMMPVMASKSQGFDRKPRIVHVGSCGGFFTLRSRLTKIDKEDILKDINDQTKWESDMEFRYILSKLLQHFAIRELASRRTTFEAGVILNIVDPGLCNTQLMRNATISMRISGFFFRLLLGRTAEMGSRSLLAGVAASDGSHGRILLNCEIGDDKLPQWMTDQAGLGFQQQLWKELEEKLEVIQPGCLSRI
ncbi:Short chain dehydrogenase FGM9 [Paramyrothecium foliicola]|nr:Short chain dehydrogenase FGM9 [Paramyrothecium foliicola]